MWILFRVCENKANENKSYMRSETRFKNKFLLINSFAIK